MDENGILEIKKFYVVEQQNNWFISNLKPEGYKS